MSSYSSFPIDYGQPRTIWSISLQLFYTLIAMIPLYYYMRNVVEIPPEGSYVLQLLPIVVAILLFFVQLRLNQFYWINEKTYKNRDIFVMSIKSVVLTLGLFYSLFFLLWSYWIGRTDIHENSGFENPLEIVVINIAVSLVILLMTLVFMVAVQEDRLTPAKLKSRIRRR